MNYKRIATTVLLINILLLSGCAPFRGGALFKSEPWKVRQAKLQQVNDWFIKGAFSITYNKKGIWLALIGLKIKMIIK